MTTAARESLPRTPRPGASAQVEQKEIILHGRAVTYRESGATSGGPVVVLLHGLASSSATWLPVMSLLGHEAHVIAPDLLGHGQSAKPPSGDYSLGAYACGIRDLLVAKGLERATVVGHSFGGGVAMQFAYQFPQLTERLVLVASGGLGRGVSLALRAASLPGTALVLQTITTITPRWLGRLAHGAARVIPTVSGSDLDELAGALTSFADGGARGAFVHTVRNALSWSGQRLDGTERLYLLAGVPVLLVGAMHDTVIPVEHTVDAHRRIPGSRLELFDTEGHFPHAEQPLRFAHVLLEFLATTTPAHGDTASLRRRLQAGGRPSALPGALGAS